MRPERMNSRIYGGMHAHDGADDAVNEDSAGLFHLGVDDEVDNTFE